MYRFTPTKNRNIPRGEYITLNSYKKTATVGIVSAIAIFPYSEFNQKFDVKTENKELIIENEDNETDED